MFVVGLDILLEFLEVAFNHVLFCRNIYPKEIFVKKKIYGSNVYIAEHPEVNKYLSNVLNSIRDLLKEDENSINAINLAFYNENKLPTEVFVFDMVKLQTELKESDPYYLKTEEALKTICLKLSMCDTYLKPLPENSTFTVEILTYETAHISLSENSKYEDFPWIIKDDGKEITNKNILPLKDIKTDCLYLHMYVIEDMENKT